jgi:hypothetical protein
MNAIATNPGSFVPSCHPHWRTTRQSKDTTEYQYPQKTGGLTEVLPRPKVFGIGIPRHFDRPTPRPRARVTVLPTPSRLWNKSAAAGSGDRRPWKTSAFPPVGQVEKGQG